MTAAGRRVLEADPGIMELLESGEVVRMIGLGGPFATELGMHERQHQYRGNGWMDKLDIWKADGVGYHSGGGLLDV